MALSGNSDAGQQSIGNPALRAELLERVDKDQAIRRELIDKGVDRSNEDVVARGRAIDADNLERLKAIVAEYGWPGPALVGKDGTEAAFLLLQHADLPFQKQMLPLVEAAYRGQQLSGQNYALLTDRVLVREGRKQRYGTQFQIKERDLIPDPIEDDAAVDERRASVGLPPLADYLKFMREMYFPKRLRRVSAGYNRDPNMACSRQRV
jgi:hypothetical protein